MSQTTITDQTKITVLKHLVQDRPAHWVATAVRITEQQVMDIATAHGYPRPESMRRAIGILEKNVADAAAAEHDRPLAEDTTPVDQPKTAEPARHADPMPDTTWANDLEQPSAEPDEIQALIDTAKAHPSKRVQAAGDRITTAIDKLRDAIREDQEKHAAKRAADAKKKAARAEIERLEKQLADARAKLRGTTTTTSSTQSAGDDGPSAAEIRTWATEQGLDCPTRGRIPQDLRDAYTRAHTTATPSSSDATSAA